MPVLFLSRSSSAARALALGGAFIGAALTASSAQTGPQGFVRVTPEQVKWLDDPDAKGLGVQRAVIQGDPAKPGVYVIRIKFPPGVMSRNHFHREDRHAVVLKGTWYTGTGDEFAPDKTVPLEAGSYMMHPAGAHHFDGAKDEEVILQLIGVGPSQTTRLRPADGLYGPSLPGRTAAAPVDSLAGTWQLNVARSTFPAGAAPRSQTTTLQAVDGGVREIVDRVNADGSTTRWDVTAKYDGRDYPVAGDPTRDTVAFSRVDDSTIEVVNKKAGAVVNRMLIVVARDGKTRTNTVLSGNTVVATMLFERK